MEVKMQPTFIVIFFLSSFAVLLVVVLVWGSMVLMPCVAVSMMVLMRQLASDSRRLMPAPLSLRGMVVHTAIIVVVLIRESVVKMA